jgi:hypothetical protein
VSAKGREAREKPRISISLPLEFVRTDGDPDAETESPDQGTIFDLSVSGVSFYANKPLKDGDRVDVRCQPLWEGHRIGIVKWCKQIKHNLFLVGVSLQ